MSIVRRKLLTYAVQKEDDYWFLHRNNGAVLDRKGWLELRAMVDAFFAQVEDDEIARYNADVEREEAERHAQEGMQVI